MDSLTPPLLTAIREIRWHLQAGRSIKESVQAYLRSQHDEFSVKLNELWSRKVQGQEPPDIAFANHRAQALWELIDRAYRGQPILEPLTILEDDVEATALSDLELHVATLPFKAMIPLLLLQFPAFAVLLIGPLLRDLMRYSLVFLAVILVSPRSGQAEALSSLTLKKMIKAKNAQDLDQIVRGFDDLRILRMACDLQLKSKTVPASCYQALALEKKWGLSSPAKTAQMRERIDQRCAEAAEKFSGLDGLDRSSLSSSCRLAVARAKELRQYWRGS
jgi:hypothetical protein